MDILARLINRKEMVFYIIIGGAATTADWMTFAVAVKSFNVPYQFGLVLAMMMGGLVHYLANKTFTFKCHSRKYGPQIFLYVSLAMISFLCSLGVMTIFIKLFAVNKVAARVLTTAFMLLPNYLLHKHLTFNKRFFLQPEINGGAN